MGKTNYQYVCGWECSFRLFWWCLSETPIYCNANATTPEPPSTYIAESYKNAYETAFVAEDNVSLNNLKHPIFSNNLPAEFINGTFGYREKYENIPSINYLIISGNYYQQPYLFISTGSGGGNGYMYLDWVFVTFGVPYEVTVP